MNESEGRHIKTSFNSRNISPKNEEYLFIIFCLFMWIVSSKLLFLFHHKQLPFYQKRVS